MIFSTAWAVGRHSVWEHNTLVTLAGEPTGQAIARVLQKAATTTRASSTNRALRVVVGTDAADFEGVRNMGGHTLFSTPRGFLKWGPPGGAVEWRLQRPEDSQSRDDAAAAKRHTWRVDTDGTVRGPAASSNGRPTARWHHGWTFTSSAASQYSHRWRLTSSRTRSLESACLAACPASSQCGTMVASNVLSRYAHSRMTHDTMACGR